VVGIIRHESAEPELRSWKIEHGDVRIDEAILAKILWQMESHGVLSVAITDGSWVTRTTKASTMRVSIAPIRHAHSATAEIGLRK
jgi:hypothetical protein